MMPNFNNFCLLLAVTLLSGAVCDYVVEVDLRAYSNEESRAAANNGECCDTVSTNSHDFNDNTCTNVERCDNLFAFCLRPSSTPSTNTGGCLTPTILSTNVVTDSDSINFVSTDVGVPNPLTFTVNGVWDGVQLYVVVLDLDQDKAGANAHDLVDRFTIELPGDLLDSTGLTLTGVQGVHQYGQLTLSSRVHCTSTYHGGKCQFVNVCERDSILCTGRGVCNAVLNTSTCNCNNGFTGDLCELIDHCFEQNCNNNGVCVNAGTSFSCSCNPGYTGLNCSVDIDDCESILCSNDGHCVDETNGYHCECAPGFTGLNCTVNINECDGQNCSGNGECVDDDNSYTCVCDAGYTGEDCQLEIDECANQNCTGNGDCIDEVNSYSCLCNAGFTGGNCETNIDDCSQEACNRVGVCVDGVNSFTCNCEPPFTGLECDEIDYCHGVNCHGNGRCVNHQRNFTCECNPGFTGELCSVNIDAKGSENGVIVEALVGGVTAALFLLLLVLILLVGAIGCLVKKRKTIITTYFPNGAAKGEDNALCGIPNNSLERNSSVKRSNTLRSDVAEFENSLYASMQSAEVCNPDYDDTVDLKKIPYHRNITQ